MTISITLDTPLEDVIKQKIASGIYTSAREVIQEALRMMEDQDRLRMIKLEQLRADIRLGLESGVSTNWDVEEIKREARQQRAARIADDGKN
jgi:antitoxin ParD1/3/4